MQHKKLLTILFVGILSILLALPMINTPSANAQTGVSKNTFPLIGALPNPVGVNQETLITTGLTHATAWPQAGWYRVTVTVYKPDNTTETLGPVTTDTTGMTGISYTPTMVGTYYLQTNFPEQKIEVTAAGTLANTTMKASTSEKYPLIVTEEPRAYYPGVPLPSEYWSRPINAQFREWQSIAGNWLNVRGYDNRLPPPNDDAPETPHLLWTRQYAEGGLVGGVDLDAINMDQISYEHGDAYEGKWSNPIIMNGILFYTQHAAQSAMNYAGTSWNYTGYEVEQRTVAVDLHTGKELWNKVLGNNERQAFGQIMYWKTMNMYGAFSYLWTTVGTTWNAYDPFTGRWEYTINNVPSGSRIVGPNGEILVYTMDNINGWLTMWNSTECVYKSYLDFYLSRPGVAGQPGGGTTNDAALAEYYAGRWRPHGIKFNGTEGIQWNVTIPKGLPTGGPSSNIQFVAGEYAIVGSNTNWAGGAAQPNPVFYAISIKPGEEGKLMWNKTWTLPTADAHADIPGSEPFSVEDDVFVVSIKETRVHYGFRLSTGQQIWGPTSPPDPWLNVFTNLYMNPWGAAVIKNGSLYTAGMGGVVNAFNVQTGEHLWTYNLSDKYTEQLFSSEWPTPIDFIVDGKIYLFTQEHSANTPIARGAPAACIDATTGEEIWRIDGLRLGSRWGGQPIIGDSIIAGFSSYDNQIVAMGRGPTATTVEAPSISATFGTPVTIRGTVTDISPGTEQDAIKLRFPHGVAAVSDDSQSEWMKYVYMQFPSPMTSTGVDVTLSVIDSNNNVYEIGKATSDTSGTYSLVWTPEISGKYTIIASFEGTNAYWPSYAETAMNVLEAPSATQSSAGNDFVMPPFELYLAIATIAIIAAIAVVGLLVLKKKA
ncbi:MAG: PQQ-binding-like beta-propeller repeat protein [Candidatus Bathyarchaeota archaeon]|nr:PQQ-binding-like beta-propeller repeat protein [Candidatus Bathyarchaeota archaeon]